MRFTPVKTLAAVAVLFAFAGSAQAADAPQCELKRPINFGAMNWESNLVLVDVERFIMEKGYGCKTETLPTETLPALAALERGDLDINTEIWLNSVADPWERAEKTGRVKRIGDLYMGGEAWYIPRYTAERLPELKSAADLPKFKDQFKDPEEPGKGRFYGCPAGWGCEVTSNNLFHALKLDDSYTLYSPGTGAAPHLRFNEDNCHAQSKFDNQWRAGNVVDYRIKLIERIGLERVEALEADNQVRKWTRQELIDIRDKYRAKTKELKGRS